MILTHLSTQHDRKAFDCGVDNLNKYLREQARQDAEKGLSRTFVHLGTDRRHILGYYTLAVSALDFDSVPNEKRLSRHPAPVALLARLAVDKTSQGQGIGERLLFDAQARAVEIADRIGVYAMTLDAQEESLCAYYAQYDFEQRADGPLRMYKTTAAIRKLGLTAAPLE